MARRLRVLALVLTVTPLGCGLIAGLRDWEEGDPSSLPGDDGAADTSSSNEGGPRVDSGVDASVDAPVDAPPDVFTFDAGPARCNRSAPFGTPVLVPGLDSASVEGGARLTPDELKVYFSSDRSEGAFQYSNIFVAERATREGTFGNVTVVPVLNDNPDASNDYAPTISGDGLSFYFTRQPMLGELFGTKRTSTTLTFEAPQRIAFAASQNVFGAFISQSGERVYYVRRSTTLSDDKIYVADHLANNSLGAESALDEINAGGGVNTAPVLSPDERTIYFATNRSPSLGGLDVYRATRSTPTGAFGAAQHMAEVSSAVADYPSWVSADDCTLYLHGKLQGHPDEGIFVANRPQ